MKFANTFSEDIDKVYSLLKDECGGDTIQEALFTWLKGDIDISADNDEDWVMCYENNERGMFYVLYDLVNYDLISIYGRKINVKYSNNKEIAEIIKKYATEETINKVYDNFFD